MPPASLLLLSPGSKHWDSSGRLQFHHHGAQGCSQWRKRNQLELPKDQGDLETTTQPAKAVCSCWGTGAIAPSPTLCWDSENHVLFATWLPLGSPNRDAREDTMPEEGRAALPSAAQQTAHDAPFWSLQWACHGYRVTCTCDTDSFQVRADSPSLYCPLLRALGSSSMRPLPQDPDRAATVGSTFHSEPGAQLHGIPRPPNSSILTAQPLAW